jgi:EmrB/QacA subfamily drug resistance transporter
MTSMQGESPRHFNSALEGDSRRRWLILAVVGVAQLMVVLDATIVNIALPSAQRSLGFSTDDRQWIVTAYSLAFGGLLVVGGRLSDLLGRKQTFVVGLVGFAAASALGGAAPSFGTLVVARAVQGGFGALLAPSALAIVSTTFLTPRERGKALGVYTAIAGAGGAVGLLLGGVLTEYLTWRWCLYVNIVFAVAALAGALTFLRDQERTPAKRLDVPGSLAAIGGLAAIVAGFSEASTRGWGDALTITLIVGGVALMGVFVLIERAVSQPLVPLAILADRVRGAAYLGLVFAGLGVIGMFLLMTYYLQSILDYSPLRAGLAFLPFVGGVVVSAAVVSNIGLRRLGPKVLVPTGMLIAAAGALWLTHLGVQGSYAVDVAPALILIGLGASAVLIPGFNLGPNGAGEANTGVASALVNSSNQIGGSLGAALLNTVAASATGRYLATRAPTRAVVLAASVHGDSVAFIVLTGLFVAGALVTAVLYPNRARIAFLQREPDLLSAPPPQDSQEQLEATPVSLAPSCGARS